MEWVVLSQTAPWFTRKTKRKTGARRRGILYEAKVQKYLSDRYEEYYLPSPWFRFGEAGKERWCQPDGLLFLPTLRRIIIVEVKHHHTAEAYWQTKLLYLPVLAKAFPAELWQIGLCEVCRWFDPAEAFPERPAMCGDLLSVSVNRFGVHIWNPSRK